MEVILLLYEKCSLLVGRGIPVTRLKKEDIFDKITGMKYNIGNDELDKFEEYKKAVIEFYELVSEE